MKAGLSAAAALAALAFVVGCGTQGITASLAGHSAGSRPTGEASASSWPVFDHDPARSGVDVGDRLLTVTNVRRLRERWQTSLGAVADSTPIYLPGVTVRGVARGMLFQTAKNGETFGIEADTGRILWRFRTVGPGYPQITTSTPAADPSGAAIYVPGVDGYVHKLDVATGRELHAPGFPLRITRMPHTEKDASALNVANGYLYATTSGFDGDAPPYDGHVVALRLSDGRRTIFNTLCSKKRTLPTPHSCPYQMSGIWSRGGAVVDPDPSMHGAVYAATGNGNFNAAAGGHNYGDSVLSLSGNLVNLLGSYTPTNYESLDQNDVDLGSTSPALLPRDPRSRTPLMLVQGGKDAILRLVDRASLPGVGGELSEVQLPAGLFATPAVWSDSSNRTWVFLGFSGEVAAYRIVTGANRKSRIVEAWRTQIGSSDGEGSSAVVSNGVVFDAVNGAVVALDATTGSVLWSSAGHPHTIGNVHWESPIVVNGRVYCSDESGNLTAFAVR
jgi:outer membrane protein assembly factor BamB